MKSTDFKAAIDEFEETFLTFLGLIELDSSKHTDNDQESPLEALEHSPGGKPHDQKAHGRRGGGGGGGSGDASAEKKAATSGGGGAEDGANSPEDFDPLKDDRQLARDIERMESRHAVYKDRATEMMYEHDSEKPGVWSGEREELHNDFVEQQTAGIPSQPPGAQLEAVIVLGTAGSGKGHTQKQQIYKERVKVKDSVYTNPDDGKEFLVQRGEVAKEGYVGLKDREASPLTHEESSKMAWDVQDAAIKNRQNLTWDVTGSSHDSVRRRVDTLRAAGYRITATYVDAPLAVAAKQAGLRYKRQRDTPQGGRYVSIKNIMKAHDSKYGTRNRRVFEELRKEGLFDDAVAFYNDGVNSPRIDNFID